MRQEIRKYLDSVFLEPEMNEKMSVSSHYFAFRTGAEALYNFLVNNLNNKDSRQFWISTTHIKDARGDAAWSYTKKQSEDDIHVIEYSAMETVAMRVQILIHGLEKIQDIVQFEPSEETVNIAKEALELYRGEK